MTRFLVSCACAVLLACPLQAETASGVPAAAPADPAALFGVRESVESIGLSPAGDRLAYVAPTKGQGSALYTVDLATGQSQVALSASGDPDRLHECRWVSERRLVCTIYAMLKLDVRVMSVSRMIAVDADGKNFKMLSERENPYQTRWSLYGGQVIDWLPGQDDKILMVRDYVPESREKTRIQQNEDGLGVIRMDTRNLSVDRIENPRLSATEYITDGHGTVRLMGIPRTAGATQMTMAVTDYLYRTKGSRDWKPFSTVNTSTSDGLNPYHVDPDLDVAYAMDKVDGRIALFRVSLDGTAHREVAYADPRYDVDDIVMLGRGRQVVGASFVSDRREIVYFDPKLKALSAALSKALPGLPLVSFVDESDDGTKLLIFAGSDTDPGRYFLFDRASHHLQELMLARPQLEGVPLSPVKPVMYPAADGTMIPGFLTLPPGSNGRNIPAIVLPHGGPSARDEWGFDWLSQYFAHRGFAVLQPNFRGSSGYGDAWFKKNGFQDWRTAIGDVTDAGRWLLSQGIAAPGKLAIFGWSYGGYASLQANVLAPGLFKAAVAVAPVTDLSLLKEQYRGYTDFALARDFIGDGPQIEDGSPARNAAKINVPVLIFQGTMDRNVDYRESTVMDAALARAGKSHQLVTYTGLDHYLDDATAREDMLSKSDAFLRKAMDLP